MKQAPNYLAIKLFKDVKVFLLLHITDGSNELKGDDDYLNVIHKTFQGGYAHRVLAGNFSRRIRQRDIS